LDVLAKRRIIVLAGNRPLVILTKLSRSMEIVEVGFEEAWSFISTPPVSLRNG
jgi:hypothetical protein